MNISNRTSVFSDQNICRYLIGQMISLTGTLMQSAVLSLLIIKMVGKGQAATTIGIQSSLGLIVAIIVGPFAGSLVDRFDKKKLLFYTTTTYSVATVLLILFTSTRCITLGLIYTTSLIGGVATAIDGNARVAIIRDLTKDPALATESIKAVTSLYTVAQILGPGLSGYVVLSIGYVGGFSLNLMSNIALIIALIGIQTTPTPVQVSKVNLLKGMIEGLMSIRKNQQLRTLILLMTGLCIFGFVIQFLLPAACKYMIGGDETTYSHIGITYGIGSMVGSYISMRYRGFLSAGQLIVFGMVLAGVSTCFVSISRDEVSLAISMSFVGMGMLMSFGTLRSAITMLADKALVGIVGGWTNSLMYLGFVVTSMIGGMVADHIGFRPVILVAGIANLILGFVAFKWVSFKDT